MAIKYKHVATIDQILEVEVEQLNSLLHALSPIAIKVRP